MIFEPAPGPYCIYCLAGAYRNSQSLIEVQTRPGPPVLDAYTGPRDPRHLGSWLAEREAESNGEAAFILDGMFGAFLMAATWHGDAVCVIHMLDFVRP